jgi:hypothetical protein
MNSGLKNKNMSFGKKRDKLDEISHPTELILGGQWGINRPLAKLQK